MSKWTSNGETIFLKLPRIGSTIYDHLMQESPMGLFYQQIAQDLMNHFQGGRLLDVGTGPGRLLRAIYDIDPTVELNGLDISPAMINQARKNLKGIDVELRQGDVRKTDFPNDYFDLVACSGSFHLWNQPEEGLQEIHRILKDGRTAYLYEFNRESDREAIRSSLKENLRHMSVMARMLGPLAIKLALDAAYRNKEEISNIVKRTDFGQSYSIQEKTISGLAIWLCIELPKVRESPKAG
jgi:ubiquinone/menaquinone biosynthesis C-methylase UbiE